MCIHLLPKAVVAVRDQLGTAAPSMAQLMTLDKKTLNNLANNMRSLKTNQRMFQQHFTICLKQI